VHYLHGDALGSVRSVTDAIGTVVAGSDYSVYGSPTEVAGLVPVLEVTAFGFAGEYTDPTGLVYLRARYYDPATAQFVSVDPLRDGTLLLYGYTAGNPLQFVDPLGLDWLQDSSDWLAGFGDTVTFGGTKAIRDLINYEMGFDDAVDYDSTMYGGGSVGGAFASLITLPYGTTVGGKISIIAPDLYNAYRGSAGVGRAYSAAVTAGAANGAYRDFAAGDVASGIASVTGVIPGAGQLASWAGRTSAVRAAAGSAITRTGTWWSKAGRWSNRGEIGLSFAGPAFIFVAASVGCDD
jgi:RHS repeat-associated protein